jgi:hypothetical protein
LSKTAFAVCQVPFGTVAAIPACAEGCASQNSAFSVTYNATNAVAPLVWSISSGNIPGLTMNPSTGVLSGVPSATGAFTIQISMDDNTTSPVAVKTCTINVLPPNPSISCPSNKWDIYYAYDGKGVGFSPTNLCAPYQYTITAGSLPPGVSINNLTSQLQGTASATGTFTFSVNASASWGKFAQISCAITINQRLSIFCPALSYGDVGQFFSASFTATGGSPPLFYPTYYYMPSFLTGFSDGKLNGTLSTGITTNFTVVGVVQDTILQQTSSVICLFRVFSKPTFTQCPPSSAILNSPYSAQLVASVPNDVAPSQFSLAVGPLPPGMTLTPAGVLSGVVSGASQTYSGIVFQVKQRKIKKRKHNVTKNISKKKKKKGHRCELGISSVDLCVYDECKCNRECKKKNVIVCEISFLLFI